MSGRDVRRLAARASTSTHQDKQIQVARLVLGAIEQGVDEIVLTDEPFRISRRAVENLRMDHRFHFIQSSITHSAADTVEVIKAMEELECKVIIVMGGDGTSRIVAKTWPESTILPISTGTNNVFPQQIEPSVAGAAAGIVATGKLQADSVARRCKQVHIEYRGQTDLALVDAVLLREKLLGNMLPYETDKISDVILAISQPASVGMSPIGGYLLPSLPEDDFGVYIGCGRPSIKELSVPVSPGLYQDVSIREIEKLELGQMMTVTGPGIIALDGDREILLQDQEKAVCTVRRDGPLTLDAYQVMNKAAQSGLF